MGKTKRGSERRWSLRLQCDLHFVSRTSVLLFPLFVGVPFPGQPGLVRDVIGTSRIESWRTKYSIYPGMYKFNGLRVRFTVYSNSRSMKIRRIKQRGRRKTNQKDFRLNPAHYQGVFSIPPYFLDGWSYKKKANRLWFLVWRGTFLRRKVLSSFQSFRGFNVWEDVIASGHLFSVVRRVISNSRSYRL